MYLLTIITETYSRTESGKSWRSQPDTTETETMPWDVTPEYIGNVAQSGEDKHRKITGTDTLKWFRRWGGAEHAVRSYTPVGFIVTRLTSTNPDRTVRKVRRFRIEDVPEFTPGITLDPVTGEFEGHAARTVVYGR